MSNCFENVVLVRNCVCVYMYIRLFVLLTAGNSTIADLSIHNRRNTAVTALRNPLLATAVACAIWSTADCWLC